MSTSSFIVIVFILTRPMLSHESPFKENFAQISTAFVEERADCIACSNFIFRKEGVMVQRFTWQSFATRDLLPRPRYAEARSVTCHQPAKVHLIPGGIIDFLSAMARIFSNIYHAGTISDVYSVSTCFIYTSHTPLQDPRTQTWRLRYPVRSNALQKSTASASFRLPEAALHGD